MTKGQTIKRIRQSKNMTQAELGELIGINEATVRRYENNRLFPKYSTIKKIASALEVSPDTIATSDINHSLAMHYLFKMFGLYGGDFKNIDGEIYLSFTELKPYIRDWYDKWKRQEKNGNAIGYQEYLDNFPHSSALCEDFLRFMEDSDAYSDSIDES